VAVSNPRYVRGVFRKAKPLSLKGAPKRGEAPLKKYFPLSFEGAHNNII